MMQDLLSRCQRSRHLRLEECHAIAVQFAYSRSKSDKNSGWQMNEGMRVECTYLCVRGDLWHPEITGLNSTPHSRCSSEFWKRIVRVWLIRFASQPLSIMIWKVRHAMRYIHERLIRRWRILQRIFRARESRFCFFVRNGENVVGWKPASFVPQQSIPPA